nr:MAG TPA: Lysis protein [Caudoviricetes sp.]
MRQRKKEKTMKKKILLVVMATVLALGVLTGCSESYKVSQNVSQEADNFNVTRKLTVINARTDTVLLELTGTFALQNNRDNELEVIIETAEGKYRKDLVYLNDYTMYVVEDISGADVNKYHYEINFLPEWGAKITHKN